MLSVIVPCYNEQENIPHILRQFSAALPAAAEAEVLLVNNGSTDNSAAIFTAELAKLTEPHPFRLVTVSQNQGYGFGILSGLEAARGDVLAWTHADLQTDPADVFRAWEVYQHAGNPNLVMKGRRKQRRWADAFFTFGMQLVVLLALRTWLSDINAQPKLFSRSFYEQYIRGKAPYDFSLDLFLLYQAKAYGAIQTIPVYFKKRLYGEAKGGGSFKTRIKLIKRTFHYIFQLAQHAKP